jgi:cell volume regulation protein A
VVQLFGLTDLMATAAGAATAGVDLDVVPLQWRLLFLGILYVGTLAISRFSIKVGIPAILGVLLLGLFINVNLLRITESQAESLQIIGLELLLFYAGLKTERQAIRGFLEYGLLLAVGGVLVASLVLGGAIWWLASPAGDQLLPGVSRAMPIGAAFLIAAALGSTDAGATLSVLAQVRHRVPERLRHLLEFESAVNDPAALLIFSLLVGLFAITPERNGSVELTTTVLDGLKNFLQQISVGVVVGALFGYVAKFIIDHLLTAREQLLIVAVSIAFVTFGTTDLVGGSGFIAVYVTGVLMTNMSYRVPGVDHTSLQEVLLPFNTMTEITIFLIFGLLVTPEELFPALPVGLATAAVLMLVARPVSVLIFQPFSPFNWRETLLIGWCGLRGAVPLALSYNVVRRIPELRGIDPLLAGSLAANAQAVVFIVVVLNLLLQGLSLPWLARSLGLDPGEAAPAG